MLGEQLLWREVLTLALEEACLGVRASSMKLPAKIQATLQVRQWITRPNADFNEVCYLAGYDPDVIRDGMVKQLSTCPTVEDLFKPTNAHLRRKNKHDRKLTCDGEALTLAEWSARYGIPVNQIDSRLRQGWSAERAVTQPSGLNGHRQGVVSNFAYALGTGGGSAAQDSPEISFQGFAE